MVVPTIEVFVLSAVTQLTTPGGTPASWNILHMARAVSGVSSEGLRTAVQPAAIAGATFLATMAQGKFQGVMSAAGPMGCWMVHILRPFKGDDIVTPSILLASSR